MPFIDGKIRRRRQRKLDEAAAAVAEARQWEITIFTRYIPAIVKAVRNEVQATFLDIGEIRELVELNEPRVTKNVAADPACTATLLKALQKADSSVVSVRLFGAEPHIAHNNTSVITIIVTFAM